MSEQPSKRALYEVRIPLRETALHIAIDETHNIYDVQTEEETDIYLVPYVPEIVRNSDRGVQIREVDINQ